MLKLLKLLKPNIMLILLCVVLVSVSGIFSLLLPDRMSTIISEGITTEYIYETAPDGSTVYMPAIFSTGGDLVPIPKIVHENAGELVLNYDDARDIYYAQVVMSSNVSFVQEVDAEGKLVYLVMPDNQGTLQEIELPQFLRTVDGQEESQAMQGHVVITDNGTPQILQKQVSNINEIWRNGLIMIIITLISSICAIINSYVSSKVGASFGRDVRHKLFKKTIRFSNEECDKFGQSSLITRMTNDVNQVQMLVLMSLRMVILVPILLIGGSLMAYRKDPELTKVLFIAIPIILVVVGIVATKVIPLFKQMQKKIDRLTLVSRENITGIRVIRAFSQDERETERFEVANRSVTGLAINAARYMAVIFPIMQLIMSLSVVGVMIIAIGAINRDLQIGALNFESIGNMMAVIQYMMQIMMSVLMLAIIFIMMPRAVVSGKRIQEVYNTENKIKNPKGGGKELKGKLSVEYKNVSFSYPNSNVNVIKDLNFKISEGDTVAIVGSTGSGKSTLINMLPRLYDVTEGQVLINGVDVREYNLTELREAIGFTPQKNILFEGTIRDNVAYGVKNADDETINWALDIAQATEFINNLDDGLDHNIEQAGANFSGGQKQRLSIARAICRKPKIFVFDDSFSALDFKTDKALRHALKPVTKKSMVILVAQRIGTVMDADTIIVLQDGVIAGQGKHRDLLKNCEVYREIAYSQMSEEEIQTTLRLEGGIS